MRLFFKDLLFYTLVNSFVVNSAKARDVCRYNKTHLGYSSSSIEEFTQADERRLKRQYNPMFSSNYATDMEVDEVQLGTSATSGASNYGLGKTMRGLIHERNRKEDNDKAHLWPEADRREDVEIPRHTDPEDENIRPMLPRCLLVGFIVLAIVGGMLALVIVAKRKEYERKDWGLNDITEKVFQECSDPTVGLNEHLSIECMVNTSHRNWTEIRKSRTAKLQAPNQKFFVYNLSDADPQAKVWTQIITVTQPMICPLYGQWLIEFQDNDKKFLYSSSLHVRITDPELTMAVPDSTISCSVSNACDNYDIKFNNGTIILDDTKSCNGTWTYNTGSIMSCRINVPEETTNLTCALYSSRGENVRNKTIILN